MTAKGKAPEDLIALAIEMLRTELQPALPADKRYASAMIANALEIARREILAAEEAAQLQLLDHFYEDGDGTMAQLAANIRKGDISDTKHRDLRQRLRAHLITELKVRNPRFLASRGVKAQKA